MTMPLSDQKIAELSELVFQRRKIEAIKLYRELTGLGLKESKDAVEELEAALQKQSPERFVTARQKGCFGSAALLGLVAGVAVYVLLRR